MKLAVNKVHCFSFLSSPNPSLRLLTLKFQWCTLHINVRIAT